ncbi:pyridoxal phosphate-dependent decarboxylase family protein [Candidatus Uabimicrobium amorphum]|uniref:Aspartate aminotransferase family protein n=1 Tax=Uabimicrobium amorphum TaxID=2596890 RepID=A0A5S9IMW8_UABAM|nr:pyridoxal-dependent decarboxylase [Candidatus Uabimicrobium amorphum]BBM84376.1 aspartate aminotransferase family protein [Candidatus Uabimicrobium amorphum]
MKDKYAALDVAFREAKQWLENLDQNPILNKADREELLNRLMVAMPEDGMPGEDVVRHLVDNCKDNLLGSPGGRFFAWVIGGGLPAALASDWLTSSWDQNAVLFACGAAVNVVEEVAGKWILELLDLPRESSFGFTTGCQLAHFTCLSAARYKVLKDLDWDVNQDGLCGAPQIGIFTSEHRHGSVDRAVRYLGLGNKCLHKIATDAKGRILKEEFAKKIQAYSGPKIVVLDAADLNIAAFDSFSELIPIAKEHNAWVHIDGAFGLFARASLRLKNFTAGIQQADSWATDAHKWLNVPFDCGIAIVKDRESHRNSMTIHAAYMPPHKTARDQIDWTPEWSRRARGVPVYAALKELGKKGVADLVERCCDHCAFFVAEMEKLPHTEIIWKPTLNQALIRFCDPEGNNSNDHDKYTQQVVRKVNESGEAFFSESKWDGNVVMRVSVVNWQTTKSDIERVVQAFKNVLH